MVEGLIQKLPTAHNKYGPGVICTHPGCTSRRNVRGLCRMHWTRLNNGVPMDKPRQVRYESGGLCIRPNCGKVRHLRGLCGMHYWRLKNGKPLDTPNMRTKYGPGVGCIHPGCTKLRHLRGLCLQHEYRSRKGLPMDGKLSRRKYPAICIEPLCTRKSKAGGRCPRHIRLKRLAEATGNPEYRLPRPLKLYAPRDWVCLKNIRLPAKLAALVLERVEMRGINQSMALAEILGQWVRDRPQKTGPAKSDPWARNDYSVDGEAA